ncbi:conjugal transfer protein TraF [Serratia proteamaculans]|uniref:conjugal transfer protein TraF n=1 Tax=Serratia proteamaculans TaxID=28151 RepID=UPI0039BE3CB3
MASSVSVRPWALPDGRTADLNEYALVLFMGGSCKFSTQMNPVLKQFASERGLRIYPYTLDGGGDASFPTPMLPRRTDPNMPIADEIMAFFGQGLPIATPTLFLVNVHTLKAWPVSQGVMEMPLLRARLSTVIAADIDGLRADQISPMLSGQTTVQTQPR